MRLNNPSRRQSFGTEFPLLARARRLSSCADLLQAYLREDQQMADWVDAKAQDVTLQFLDKEERAAA
jgi:ferritin-like metal-binding protein YciE